MLAGFVDSISVVGVGHGIFITVRAIFMLVHGIISTFLATVTFISSFLTTLRSHLIQCHSVYPFSDILDRFTPQPLRCKYIILFIIVP